MVKRTKKEFKPYNDYVDRPFELKYNGVSVRRINWSNKEHWWISRSKYWETISTIPKANRVFFRSLY